MSEDYSGALKVAAEALAKEVLDLGGEAYDGELSEAVLSDATAIVKALAAACLLLPEGAEKEDPDFELLWFNASAMPVLWGADDLEHARNLASQLPPGTEYLIRQRDSWVGRWSVVEPVAIQDRSKEIDHG